MSTSPPGMRTLVSQGAAAARTVSWTVVRYTCRASSSSSAPVTADKRYPPTIFSGIQPTGIPHLGNYLGLFQPFLQLQATSHPSTPIYLSVVGLHAITLPQNASQLLEDRKNALAALLAAGVDPERTVLFFQEDVVQHAELAWILNTITSVGRLQRMTTWKSRLATARSATLEQVSESDLRLGLLAYPVLQAADVLLYKSTVVPVGEDQQQHLELARDIAQTFNTQFGPVFPLPEVQIVPSKRILSLKDPSSKMSKSAPSASSRILLTDSPSVIVSKLKSAVTDSTPSITYDPAARPGLANLLTIWSALDHRGRSPADVARFAGQQGWGMKRLKDEVGELLVARLGPIAREFERIRKDEGYLSEVAKKGRDRAGDKAAEVMHEVRSVVGLGRI